MQENENRDNASYGERLKALIKAKGMTALRFSSMAGISNSNVSEAMRDPTRSYKEKTVGKILETFPDVSPNWLRHGEGKMFLEPGQIVVNSPKGDETGNVRGSKAAQAQLNINSDGSALQTEVVKLRAELEGEKRALQIKEEQIDALKGQIEILNRLVSALEGSHGRRLAG